MVPTPAAFAMTKIPAFSELSACLGLRYSSKMPDLHTGTIVP